MENIQPLINNKEKLQPPFEIKEKEVAEKFIAEKYAEGVRPVVTVPKKYLEYLKQGLRPYATWIGIPLIAATFAREPYISKGEERVIVNVKGIDKNKIKPRFTGPNKAFSGVVVLEPPIPPEAIVYEA